MWQLVNCAVKVHGVIAMPIALLSLILLTVTLNCTNHASCILQVVTFLHARV